MTVFLPTCRMDVLRGEAADEFGDARDSWAVVAAGVPCSVVEMGLRGRVSQREQQPASGTPRTVRHYRARFRPGADVRTGDRLRDVRGGSTYLVEGVSAPTDLVGAADLLCDLKRVTGSG